MEVAIDEEPVTQTESDLEPNKEERKRALKEKELKKKATKKEKAAKTKEDDGICKKPAKKAVTGTKVSTRIKTRSRARLEEEERLKREEEKDGEEEEEEEDDENEEDEERVRREEEDRQELTKKLRKEKILRENNSGISHYMIIFFILIACVSLSLFFNKRQTLKDPKLERLSRWKASFNDLISNYGSVLPNISQRVIDKSMKRLLERTFPSEKYNNIEPAVLLLVGSHRNAPAVRCVFLSLSRSIADIFEEAKAPIISAEKLSKLDLHNELHKVLGTENLHTVILDGIERLDGNAAMSLHPFTDHDKALYLDVILLLTAYTDTHINKTGLKVQQVDKIASNLLEVSWGEMLPDETVSALLSRVTPSVVIISDTTESQTWNCK